MLQKKVEQPLSQVRSWKKKVSASTKGMAPEEAVRYFRRGAEDIWRKYGYNCIEINNKSCKHIK